MDTLRKITAAGLVSALLLVSTTPAQAAKFRCKSDPIVLLSDGTTVDVNADIGTAPWNVKSVTYTLRIPKGVRAIAVIPTPSWPTTVEKFTILSGNPPKTYSSTMTVVTSDSNVGVSANMLVGLAYSSVPGKNGKPITVQVTAPSILGAVGNAAGLAPVTDGVGNALNTLLR